MSDRQLVIVGAGQHGRLILDCCLDAGISVKGLLDDGDDRKGPHYGFPVLGGFALIDDPSFIAAHEFIVGIGRSQNGRRLWAQRLIERGACLRSVIHPSAVISRHSFIGHGSFVKQQAVVLNDSSIGAFTVLDCHCCIGHDVILGDNVFVAPSAQINGGTQIGEDAYIGSGTITIPHIRIGRRSVTAAGSIVTRHVPDEVLVGGTPAIILKTATSHIMDGENKRISSL